KRTYGTSIVNGTSQTNTEHDTYYVYDDYGNLTYVLPPKMDASDTDLSTITGQLDDLGYQYKYDNKNRLVEKKIPGKDPEYIVYNTLDQPILTQDAIQKANGEWLFTKYDAFGRVAYTGKATSATTTTREVVQTEVNALSGNLWVTQSTSSTNYGGLNNVFYNNGAYPNNSGTLVTLSEILTINYYDTYVDRPTSAPSSVVLMESSSSETNATNVKSLATVSKVKVLDVTGTDVWINTLSYYDTKSRPIYVYSENTYLGTVDIIETKLDFVGKPLKSKTTHTRNGITIATIDNFTYDHTGRLLTQTQCIGDQTMGYTCPGSSATVVDLPLTGNITSDQVASRSITLTNGAVFPDNRLWISPEIQEVIVDNSYDELGQLENKGVGGNILNTDRLQTVDYTYNIRGWLKGINNTGGSHSAITLGTGDLFGFQINYNNPNTGTALFNGNISQTLWETASINTGSTETTQYTYSYDALNRITGALSNNTTNYNLGLVDYDKNGNIQHLERNGHRDTNITLFGLMDDLTYTYEGNRLKAVDDDNTTASAITGFIDGAESTQEYTYDLNGNMLRDSNKGINSDIQYNHLNLPTQVALASGTISYIYDATGVKLQKKVIETGKPDAYTYYAGNYIYQDSALKFFNHPEGYLEPKNESDLSQGFNYVYQYKDHLGNVRLSYMDSDGDGSITASTEILEENNYYPFGLKHKGYNNAPVTNHPYKYSGKELNEELGLDWYDFGARNYDATLGRWMNIDNLAGKWATYSPYAYTVNNPIYFIDPNGEDVYLFYAVESDKEEDNAMFWQAAMTRAMDLLKSGELGEGDIFKATQISDLGGLEKDVEDKVSELSPKYGKTREFGIWSHAALDGPVGSVQASQGNLYSNGSSNQLSMEAWGNIDFNWANNGETTAGFYGCNTGNDERGKSFANLISGLPNYKDVSVLGQTTYAYPSLYTNIRTSNSKMREGNFENNSTYMVGGNKFSINGKYFKEQANPIEVNKNGKVIGNKFQKGKKHKRKGRADTRR
ncbi:MAG: RHS repeat-associated core domain-containing protein, partial [Algibacter sp.]